LTDVDDERVVETPVADDHGQPDRCPFPRPFTAEFAGCPAFQPVAFVAADSLNKPLGSELTCRHLVVGGGGNGHSSRFYARCVLGGSAGRMHWLAVVGRERVEVMRSLQEEFDEQTREQREELFAAKVALLAAPDVVAAGADLDRAMAGFLAATRAVLDEREERFADVGLPVAPLMRLVEDWAQAWTRSRDLDLPQLGSELMRALGRSPVADGEAGHAALVGRPVTTARRVELTRVRPDPAPPPLVVGTLRVERSDDPPGLRLAGEVDAANVEALAELLSRAALAGGELHVDIAEVLFCDLGGLRALVRALQESPHCRMVVHGMPGHLRRALHIAGWAELPGLALADEAMRP
jgi:anti-anti-sigma factor